MERPKRASLPKKHPDELSETEMNLHVKKATVGKFSKKRKAHQPIDQWKFQNPESWARAQDVTKDTASGGGAEQPTI